MKLSISNIAWDKKQDEKVYELLNQYGFSGVEIAPTRIFPEHPYDRLEEASDWNNHMREQYGLEVSSMQSIWYGRTEQLFGTEEERTDLLDYTKKAVDFARSISCRNLVFGCPKNRVIPNQSCWKLGVNFFRELGEYAYENATVIGIEANPAIYHTNYVNDTATALELIEEVHSLGFLLNLDIGTMIENNEGIELLEGKIDKINHVHISEPNLKPIRRRELHIDLFRLLKRGNYNRFVSIEMGKVEDLKQLESTLQYVKGIANL